MVNSMKVWSVGVPHSRFLDVNKCQDPKEGAHVIRRYSAASLTAFNSATHFATSCASKIDAAGSLDA